MKLFTSRFVLGTSLSLLLAGSSFVFGAAKPGQKIPFHGKLQSVDASAETITLSGKSARVFHVLPTTKITDGSGAASSLSAATVGEDVGGSYVKEADGNMNLFSVRFGAKTGSKAEKSEAAAPAPSPVVSTPATTTPVSPAATVSLPAAAPVADAPAKQKKSRFSGKVVSVDAAGNTLVVHGKADETYTVTSATKITGAAALSDVTAGQKVSGTCVKDGATNTVATLKVGK